MEDLSSLELRKQMLEIELTAISQKINLLKQATTVKNVPKGENLTNIHITSSGRQTDHTQDNSMAIPGQTAPGKESTNPLMAVALPKSILKETTTPLPYGKTSLLIDPINPDITGTNKMTILSSDHSKSPKTEDLRPDYRKALAKSAERFYVIYKGPHTGIHTDWGVVETFLKVDKVTCKKFSNETSARLSLIEAEKAISSTIKKTLLKPKIHKIKDVNRDQRYQVPQEIEDKVTQKILAFEDFRMLWNKIRAAGPEDFIHEKFYSTDKKTKSLYNFVEGADAALIYDAFSAGLIDNIYPSANLQELKFFPRKMIDSIKNFRKKVLQARDDPIYIKVISSLPEWQQGIYFTPYHYMEIGLAKSKKELQTSQPMDEAFPETIQTQRIAGLRRIAEKIIDFISGSKKKVNYADSHCIITSWSFKTCSEEDIELVSIFGERFKNNTLEATANTKTVFCRHAEALFEEHYCHYCKADSQTIEDPSTEEIESLSSENSR